LNTESHDHYTAHYITHRPLQESIESEVKQASNSTVKFIISLAIFEG